MKDGRGKTGVGLEKLLVRVVMLSMIKLIFLWTKVIG